MRGKTGLLIALTAVSLGACSPTVTVVMPTPPPPPTPTVRVVSPEALDSVLFEPGDFPIDLTAAPISHNFAALNWVGGTPVVPPDYYGSRTILFGSQVAGHVFAIYPGQGLLRVRDEAIAAALTTAVVYRQVADLGSDSFAVEDKDIEVVFTRCGADVWIRIGRDGLSLEDVIAYAKNLDSRVAGVLCR